MYDEMTTQIGSYDQRFEESTSVSGESVVAFPPASVALFSSTFESGNEPNDITLKALEEAMNPQSLESFENVDSLLDDLQS
jgi:hypothetical protein